MLKYWNTQQIVIQENLEKAQHRMKSFADAKRIERTFETREMVYLKPQPYRQGSVALRRNLKLALKFYGSYKILEKIVSVAYRLELSNSSRIHLTFHVSHLKKYIGTTTTNTILPTTRQDGTTDIGPLRILEQRIVQNREEWSINILFSGKNCSIDEATWEDEELLKQNYPQLHKFFEGGVNVSSRLTKKSVLLLSLVVVKYGGAG